jgi:GNAT superfamily N-acetyltransferase
VSRAQHDLRVRLTPPDEIDSLQLPWLGEAYAALDGRSGVGTPLASSADLVAAAAARWPAASLALVTLRDGEPVGFALVERRGVAPERALSRTRAGSAIIHALAIRRADRNLGHGVEAVTLVEAAEGVARLYAPVPRSNGLALYFWLRAGFRPVRDDDDRERSRDPLNLWMLRSLDISGARRDP